MKTEVAMRKRKALFQGEVGLFAVDETSAEDLALVANDVDVLATLKQTQNIKLLRKMWVLAGLLAQSSDAYQDKDEALDELCLRAKHFKMVVNPLTGMAHMVRRSVSGLGQPALSRLFNRMVHIVITDILPGLPESTLRRQIEEMVMPTGDRRAA